MHLLSVNRWLDSLEILHRDDTAWTRKYWPQFPQATTWYVLLVASVVDGGNCPTDTLSFLLTFATVIIDCDINFSLKKLNHLCIIVVRYLRCR